MKVWAFFFEKKGLTFTYANTNYMTLKKLNLAVESLEAHIENNAVSNPKTSDASVGWHVDHSLKVINRVVASLQSSDPKMYANNFSFLGKVFFTLGFFPRGKAKAPKYVKPPEVILKEDLISQTELAKDNINTIAELDKNAFFKHPIFGNVNTTRVTRFWKSA